ncbi:MAG: cytochrome c oxidase subunit II [Acidobacteriota bacterium]
MFGLKLFPDQASTTAWPVDAVFLFILALSLLVLLSIGGAILFFVIKYRRRSEDEIPPQIEGSNRLELAWTIIPFGAFMVFFFLGANIYLSNAQPPPNSMEIYVVARQWMWKFEHAEGQQEINELHVPVGRPVKLIMTSQDVIHSFFIPDFRIKQDVLPDRYTTAWFEATKPGRYHLFCSQYCGTEHAEMTGTILVMEPAEYQGWLSGGGIDAQSPADAGRKLFEQMGCAGCHQTNGRGAGPSLEGVFGTTVRLQGGGAVKADEDYVRESILDPTAKIVEGFQPVMPSFRGKLTEQQIMALIAYIVNIGAQPQGAPPGETPGNVPPVVTPGP